MYLHHTQVNKHNGTFHLILLNMFLHLRIDFLDNSILKLINQHFFKKIKAFFTAFFFSWIIIIATTCRVIRNWTIPVIRRQISGKTTQLHLNEKLTISYNSEGARVKIKVGITPSIWLSFRRLFIHFSDMKKKKKKKKEIYNRWRFFKVARWVEMVPSSWLE